MQEETSTSRYSALSLMVCTSAKQVHAIHGMLRWVSFYIPLHNILVSIAQDADKDL
jgi:hypothetical protein